MSHIIWLIDETLKSFPLVFLFRFAVKFFWKIFCQQPRPHTYSNWNIDHHLESLVLDYLELLLDLPNMIPMRLYFGYTHETTVKCHLETFHSLTSSRELAIFIMLERRMFLNGIWLFVWVENDPRANSITCTTQNFIFIKFCSVNISM